MIARTEVYEVLRHPLLLLVVTALIRIDRLSVYFADPSIDWATLQNIELKSGGFEKFQDFMKAWFGLKDALLIRTAELVQKILKLPVAMFR